MRQSFRAQRHNKNTSHIWVTTHICQSTENKTIALKDNHIPMPQYENHILHKTCIHICSTGTMYFKGTVVRL